MARIVGLQVGEEPTKSGQMKRMLLTNSIKSKEAGSSIQGWFTGSVVSLRIQMPSIFLLCHPQNVSEVFPHGPKKAATVPSTYPLSPLWQEKRGERQCCLLVFFPNPGKPFSEASQEIPTCATQALCGCQATSMTGKAKFWHCRPPLQAPAGLDSQDRIGCTYHKKYPKSQELNTTHICFILLHQKSTKSLKDPGSAICNARPSWSLQQRKRQLESYTPALHSFDLKE